MKKFLLKITALLLFTTVAVSGCSVAYRERHAHHDDPHLHDHDNDHHNYRGY